MEQSDITYKCEFNPSKPGSCIQIKGRRRTEPRPEPNLWVKLVSAKFGSGRAPIQTLAKVVLYDFQTVYKLYAIVYILYTGLNALIPT
jgi:hypothetical protein